MKISKDVAIHMSVALMEYVYDYGDDLSDKLLSELNEHIAILDNIAISDPSNHTSTIEKSSTVAPQAVSYCDKRSISGSLAGTHDLLDERYYHDSGVYTDE